MSTKTQGAVAEREALRRALAERTSTNASDWYPVFKARQGMKVVFDQVAQGLRPGARAEVLTQLFTCCTAVDPIMAAGLVPAYGDISPHTLALDIRALPLTERTRVVMLQHTFGICDQRADVALRDAAHAWGAILVEDCAHCAGRLSKDASASPIADVSVHSFGVEKMMPTHFGGAVWLNPDMSNAALRERIARALDGLPEVDAARARAARLYLNEIRVLNHLPHALSRPLRAQLESAGLFEPAISDVELAGGLGSEPALPDAWVSRQACQAVRALSSNEARRGVAVTAYASALEGVSATPGSADWVCRGGLSTSQPLLQLGVFLNDPQAAKEAIGRLRGEGIYAQPWYRPLLFPGVTDERAYGIQGGMRRLLERLPVTRACSEGAVCLPTDVAPSKARHALDLALGRGSAA